MDEQIAKKIRSAIKLPFIQKIMFCINWMLCGIARAITKLFSYKFLARYFGKNYKMLQASTLITQDQRKQAYIIGRSIRLAAKYTPWNSNCLTQAIVAKFWCKYYNIPYMFFIGIALQRSKPLGQEAHAWISAGPIFVTGGNSFTTHAVIATYSNI